MNDMNDQIDNARLESHPESSSENNNQDIITAPTHHVSRRRSAGGRARSRPPGAPAGSRRPPSRPGSRGAGAARGTVRVADLFAGIGGFHLAFERAGGTVVFASENDGAARLTYEANFRHANQRLFDSGNFAGDITRVDAAGMPDFDVLTAGFPCQPFSFAGKRRGFDDARGTMFFEVARILAAKRPAAYFLENVKGLKHHDHGRTLETIQNILTHDLGYSFHHAVVRACDFGLPQLRPRLFMVGFRDPATPFTWPAPVPLAFTLSDLLAGQANRDISLTIIASGRNKQFGTPFCWDVYLVDDKEHRLTVDDVRALQGFPADFSFPVSTIQAFKQLGNAVAIPAVEATARSLITSLQAQKRDPS